MDNQALMALTGRDLWAMDEVHLREMFGLFPRLVGSLTAEETEARMARQTKPTSVVVGRVALLSVHGYISHRPSFFSALFGGAVTTALAAQLRAAIADPEVDAVLMDISSPGGSVHGVEELAREIRAAREVKTIVAVANAYAFSAAYYLASQASELAVIPSGEVGSIGVLLVHADYSRALADEGVTVTIIRAGKYKAEANPYEPLTDDAKAYEQTRVSEYYRMFVDSVAAGRNVTVETVEKTFGQGRIVGATRAVELGMADRVSTVEQEIQRLAGRIAERKAIVVPAGAESDTGRAMTAETFAAIERERFRLEEA